MNNRVAKQLKRKAFQIASEKFGKTISVKIKSKFPQHWEENSPKDIYKKLKKAYSHKLLILNSK